MPIDGLGLGQDLPFLNYPMSVGPFSLSNTNLWDTNKTKWCNGFYIEFRQSFTKETFSYDEHLKS